MLHLHPRDANESNIMRDANEHHILHHKPAQTTLGLSESAWNLPMLVADPSDQEIGANLPMVGAPATHVLSQTKVALFLVGRRTMDFGP